MLGWKSICMSGPVVMEYFDAWIGTLRSQSVLSQLPWEPSTFKPDWPAQLFDAVYAVMHYLYHHEPSAALKKELSQAGSGLIDYCNQELIRRGGGYKSQKIKGAYFGNEIYNEELTKRYPTLISRYTADKSAIEHTFNKYSSHDARGDIMEMAALHLWLHEDYVALAAWCTSITWATCSPCLTSVAAYFSGRHV